MDNLKCIIQRQREAGQKEPEVAQSRFSPFNRDVKEVDVVKEVNELAALTHNKN